MSSATATFRRVVVVRKCRAPSRDHRDPTRAGLVCGQILGHLPKRLRFVGLMARMPLDPRTIATIRCSRCKTWNLFRILPVERGSHVG